LNESGNSGDANSDLLDINALLARKEAVGCRLEKIVGPPLPKKTSQEVNQAPAANHWNHLLQEMVYPITCNLPLFLYKLTLSSRISCNLAMARHRCSKGKTSTRCKWKKIEPSSRSIPPVKGKTKSQTSERCNHSKQEISL
jgi:hypothetical protein